MEALYEAFYTDNRRSVLLFEYSANSALFDLRSENLWTLKSNDSILPMWRKVNYSLIK